MGCAKKGVKSDKECKADFNICCKLTMGTAHTNITIITMTTSTSTTTTTRRLVYFARFPCRLKITKSN
jgi:hypothetical protein